MPYDHELAERIRTSLAGEHVVEKAMFGGLAFLVGGNMAVAASGAGGLLARVDPAESEELVRSGRARLMEMGGRSMAGWLRIDSDALRTKASLESWIRRSVAFAKTLPPKGARGKASRRPRR